MSQIENHFIEIINKQLFRNAAEKAIFLLAFYQNKTTENKTAKHLISESEKLIDRISNTQVINPMQYDSLYADVLNSVKSIIAEFELLPNAKKVWEYFLTDKSKIERFIINENIAVCNNIFTKDGRNIAFCFAFEDRYFEYDEQVFVQNPSCFYIEDREVLAVTNRAQGLLPLDDYLSIAKNHPTDAIRVLDKETQIDILLGEKSELLTGEKSDWYW